MPSHCDPISWSSSWRQEGLHCRGMPKAEENSSSYICRKRRRAAAAAVKRIPRHKLRLMAIVICPCPLCLTSKQDRWIAECSQTSHGPYGLLSSSVPFQPHVPWRIRQRLVTLCSDKRKTQSRRAFTNFQANAIDSRASWLDPTEMEDLLAINGTPPMQVSSREKTSQQLKHQGECKSIQPTFRLDTSDTRERVMAFRSIIHKADCDLHFYSVFGQRSAGLAVTNTALWCCFICPIRMRFHQWLLFQNWRPNLLRKANAFH